MKGYTKKLAVFVIIATIAMFIVAAMATADSRAGKKAIHGEYAFTAPGSCLIAILGFNASLQPNGGPAGPWFTGPVTYDGVLTFNKDGTGSGTATVRVHTLYSQGLGAPPDAGRGDASWNFTYTVTDSGELTITPVKGSFELDFTDGPNAGTKAYAIVPPWNGLLSPDGKIFYVSLGAPNKIEVTVDKANTILTGVQEICNLVFQGFRISP